MSGGFVCVEAWEAWYLPSFELEPKSFVGIEGVFVMENFIDGTLEVMFDFVLYVVVPLIRWYVTGSSALYVVGVVTYGSEPTLGLEQIAVKVALVPSLPIVSPVRVVGVGKGVLEFSAVPLNLESSMVFVFVGGHPTLCGDSPPLKGGEIGSQTPVCEVEVVGFNHPSVWTWCGVLESLCLCLVGFTWWCVKLRHEAECREGVYVIRRDGVVEAKSFVPPLFRPFHIFLYRLVPGMVVASGADDEPEVLTMPGNR